MYKKTGEFFDRVCGAALLLCAVLLYSACNDMLDAEKPIYEQFLNKVSIAGTATSAGWDLDNAIMMTNIGGKTYQWEGSLSAGELKFAWQKPDFLNGSWYMASKFAMPVEDDLPYDLVFVSNGLANNNWEITKAGNYRITVDLFSKTVVFSEISMPDFATIYIIGAATPGNWDLTSATPMTKGTDNTWTWTGNLSANNAGGGLKFICKINTADTLAYATSPEFWPDTNNDIFSAGEHELIYAPNGGGNADQTFTVNAAGNYTITLNPVSKQVVVVRN